MRKHTPCNSQTTTEMFCPKGKSEKSGNPLSEEKSPTSGKKRRVRRLRRQRLPRDPGYRLTFSYREVMEQFLREFVPITGPARYETLERYPETHINSHLHERRGDLVWRMQLDNAQLMYIVILTEFQHRNDPLMAVRVNEYVAVFLLALYRSGALRPGEPLPLILPIVLHTGDDAWTAPQSLETMFPPAPEALQPYQPQQRYFLLDVENMEQAKLADKESIPALIFRLQRVRSLDDIDSVLDDMAERLEAPHYEELRRILCQWAVYVAQRIGIGSKVSHVKDIKEFQTMIKADRTQWQEELIQKGKELGEKEGLEKGKALGEKEGWKKGAAVGEKAGARAALMAVARNLLGRHLDEKQIIDITGLSREDIRLAAAEGSTL